MPDGGERLRCALAQPTPGRPTASPSNVTSSSMKSCMRLIRSTTMTSTSSYTIEGQTRRLGRMAIPARRGFHFPSNTTMSPRPIFGHRSQCDAIATNYPNLNRRAAGRELLGELSHQGERLALAMPQRHHNQPDARRRDQLNRLRRGQRGDLWHRGPVGRLVTLGRQQPGADRSARRQWSRPQLGGQR